MDWVPVVLFTFKILVFGTGMFFAVKWHYDKEKEGRGNGKRVALRAGGTARGIFVLALLGLGLALVTFVLIGTSSLELTFP